MNIFYLDSNITTAAHYHCDKHIVKMITEYSQLLSTAHRLLDGKEYYEDTRKRKIKRWKLSDSREELLMKASHINHPCNVWVRHCKENYLYLRSLLIELIKEYEHRFKKYDKYVRSKQIIKLNPPNKISSVSNTLSIPQAMPPQYKHKDPIIAYRNYYVGEKMQFAKWTNRSIPNFIYENM